MVPVKPFDKATPTTHISLSTTTFWPILYIVFFPSSHIHYTTIYTTYTTTQNGDKHKISLKFPKHHPNITSLNHTFLFSPTTTNFCFDSDSTQHLKIKVVSSLRLVTRFDLLFITYMSINCI